MDKLFLDNFTRSFMLFNTPFNSFLCFFFSFIHFTLLMREKSSTILMLRTNYEGMKDIEMEFELLVVPDVRFFWLA